MEVYAIDLADQTVNPLARIANFGTILNVIIPIFMLGAALIFLAMLIMGAFTFLTAGGNPENMKKAQGTLFSAVLGILVVASSYLIVKLITYFFKIDLPI
jgi:hypothetical protein